MIEWAVRKKYFQNANHAIWFLTTSAFAGCVLLYYFLPDNKWVWLVPIVVFHISPIVRSVRVVRNNQASEIYSEGCIWFNMLMIIFYSLIGIIVHR